MNNNSKAENGPQADSRALSATWCLWEKYQEAQAKNSANYDQSLQVIYEFGSLETFALLWKYTTYSTPSKLLYDASKEATKKFKLFEDDPEDKIVESLFVFKRDIKPKWEDPANQYGCSIFCDLKHPTARQIDQVWHDLVFAVIGQNFPFSPYINGFRVLDRQKKFNNIKLELWLSKGTGAYKLNSEEWKEAKHIIDTTTAHLHGLIARTMPVSLYEFTTKDHLIASKLG